MTRPFLLFAAAAALTSCNRPDQSPQITVANAWARPTVAGQTSAAAYATIANAGDGDRLIAASSPAASHVTLHMTQVTNGVARMRQQAEGISVPAGERVELAPGGTHVMLTGLKTPLLEGGTFELRLNFERAGEKVVVARIADAAVAGGHEGH